MSKAAVGDEAFARPITSAQETSLIVTGTVRADARAPGGYELDVTGLEVVARVARLPDHAEGARRRLPDGPPAPLDPRRSGSRRSCACATRSSTPSATSSTSRGFILVDTPIFTPAACEGTTTLFPVQYFDDTTAYLTQSGQLYNEANAMALGTVYCFGPTFRAEKSKTRRHLTEFWMVEPEMAYADLDDVMDAGRGARRRRSSRACSTSGARELDGRSSATRRSSRAVQAPFPRITYDEAAKLLHDEGAAVRVGRRLRRRRRDGALGAVRSARCASTATRRRSRRST